MKKGKKGKKSTTYTVDIQKDILVLSMLICIFIAMIAYWIFAYHQQHSRISENTPSYSYKVSTYVETDGSTVKLKNIDESIIDDFQKEQEQIDMNKVSSVDIKKGIYKDILSVAITYTLKEDPNSEKIIAVNIDLVKNKLVPNDDIIAMANSTYKKIATDIFNEYIKLPTDSHSKVKDAISDNVLTATEFNDNSEKYIIRIREKLPDIIKLYIDEYKAYYIVPLSQISKVCYQTEESPVNIKKELGKI